MSGATGDTNNSATMKVWLHKAVIKKLSENGGKVSADLAFHGQHFTAATKSECRYSTAWR